MVHSVKVQFLVCLAAAVILLFAAAVVQAQHRGQLTVQVYQAYNESQQLTLVKRLARSQQEVVDSCAAGLSTEELRGYFNQWIEENPGYLSRELALAFAAAVLDRCIEDAEPERPSRLERIEGGGWSAVPYALGLLNVEVFNDYTFTADDPDDEVNDLFTETRLDLVAMFARQLYLEAGFNFAPEGDPPPGNAAFENHGLRVDTLALTWDREWLWLSGGKGTANFGIAANLAPGIWGGDILFDAFTVKERIGFSGNVNLGSDRTGHHSLYAGAFMADTSFLSRPYLSDGEVRSRSDGGPSNTGGLNSYVFTIDGNGIPGLGDLRYYVSVMKQAVDRINDAEGEPLPSELIDDERRLVAALEWSAIGLGEATAVTPLIEYGHLWNARGLRDRDERFLTASILLTTGRWNLALAGTGWTIEEPEEEEFDFTQLQISGGYSFASGIGLDIGYRHLDEFGARSHTLGFMFSYDLPFAG